jgi:putative FmdB family regulatory protein
MPNYDYKCEKCGEKFIRIVPLAATEEERLNQKCDCGGDGKRDFMTQGQTAIYVTGTGGMTRRKIH